MMRRCGATLDEEMALSLADFDKRVADNLHHAEDLLRSHGATPLELAIELEHLREDAARERIAYAVRLRAWFLRGGVELH